MSGPHIKRTVFLRAKTVQQANYIEVCPHQLPRTKSHISKSSSSTSHSSLSLSRLFAASISDSQAYPFPMKPSPKPTLFFSSTTVIYTYDNDHSTPYPQSNSTQVPAHSSTTDAAVPITLRQSQSNAAIKIQSFYRAHRIRALYRKISSVNSEADQLQRLIQRQETVDAVRSSELEKLRMNEALMALLLRLDSVPGIDPTVREARRKVSRRIVGLQDILDSICEAKVDEYNWWWDCNGLMKNWDDIMADMEESVCRERGGDEMERFCVENLGFRCLQRFLREP